MGEALQLLMHRLHHLGMAVAGVQHGNAGGEVDIAAALDVPDLGVLRPVGENLRLDADPAGNRPRTAFFDGLVQHALLPGPQGPAL
jgi:hypothetical protein